MRELERRENHLRPHPRLLARLAPAKAARDHQVQDEKERIAEVEDDPFADAAHADDRAAIDRLDRRIDRAEHEGAEEREPLEPAANHEAIQGFEVDNDIGQFWHYAIKNLEFRIKNS